MKDPIIREKEKRNFKKFEQIRVEVLSKEEEGRDSYKLIFSIPNSVATDAIDSYMDTSRFTEYLSENNKQEGVFFPVGAGVGIPPFQEEKSHLACSMLPLLKDGTQDCLKWITPYQGYAGPDLACPSKALLELLNSKLNASHPYKKTLENILTKPEEITLLQNTYDVYDILKLFPKILTAQEIHKHQEEGPVNRTYSVIPEPELSKQKNTICFSISVKKHSAKVQQNMFNENQEAMHYGINSFQLISLRPGDFLTINKTLKPSKALTPKTTNKSTYKNSDVIFISQGNALERCITLLYDKKSTSEKFTIFAGFRSYKHITGRAHIRTFLKSGHITQIHFALSRDSYPQKKLNTEQTETYHDFKRIDSLLAEYNFSSLRKKTVFYITGSEEFCETIKEALRKNKTIENSYVEIRVATSPTRLKTPRIAL